MADDADITGHVRTYDSLIGIMKWGALAVAAIAAAVIWLIAK